MRNIVKYGEIVKVYHMLYSILQYLQSQYKHQKQNSLDHTSSVMVKHGIVLFAGNIEQLRLPGDPARRTNIDATRDNLSKGPYFVVTADSLAINRHCSTWLSGFFVPAPAEGCTLDAVFAEKIPKIQDDEDEKWLVGTNILAYLKWLIYTAAIKDLSVEPREEVSGQWTNYPQKAEEAARVLAWQVFAEQKDFLLKDDGNVAGGPDGEQLKIYHDDDDDNAQPPAGPRGMARAVLEIEWMLANSLVQRVVIW